MTNTWYQTCTLRKFQTKPSNGLGKNHVYRKKNRRHSKTNGFKPYVSRHQLKNVLLNITEIYHVSFLYVYVYGFQISTN